MDMFFYACSKWNYSKVGSVENDFIRNVTGDFGMDGIIGSTAGVVWGGHGLFYENGTNQSITKYT